MSGLPYVHPAERIAAAIFLISPLSGILSTFRPEFRYFQMVATICVSFVGPFLVIYSAVRSRPYRIGNALATALFAMIVMLYSYADIYLASGLLIDSTTKPVPLPIKSINDALYFSVVTWTTLGYGDLQPQGICRAIAATEALVGYVFMGMFVALGFSYLSNSKAHNG